MDSLLLIINFFSLNFTSIEIQGEKVSSSQNERTLGEGALGVCSKTNKGKQGGIQNLGILSELTFWMSLNPILVRFSGLASSQEESEISWPPLPDPPTPPPQTFKVDEKQDFSYFESNINGRGEQRKENWDSYIGWASLGLLRHTQIV